MGKEGRRKKNLKKLANCSANFELNNVPISERGVFVDFLLDILDGAGDGRVENSRRARPKVAQNVIAFFLVVEDVLHFEITMANRSLAMMKAGNGHANVAKDVQDFALLERRMRKGWVRS